MFFKGNRVIPNQEKYAKRLKYANKLDFAVLGKVDGIDEKVLTGF